MGWMKFTKSIVNTWAWVLETTNNDIFERAMLVASELMYLGDKPLWYGERRRGGTGDNCDLV
jgi:hypothetical protein